MGSIPTGLSDGLVFRPFGLGLRLPGVLRIDLRSNQNEFPHSKGADGG